MWMYIFRYSEVAPGRRMESSNTGREPRQGFARTPGNTARAAAGYPAAARALLPGVLAKPCRGALPVFELSMRRPGATSLYLKIYIHMPFTFVVDDVGNHLAT